MYPVHVVPEVEPRVLCMVGNRYCTDSPGSVCSVWNHGWGPAVLWKLIPCCPHRFPMLGLLASRLFSLHGCPHTSAAIPPRRNLTRFLSSTSSCPRHINTTAPLSVCHRGPPEGPKLSQDLDTSSLPRTHFHPLRYVWTSLRTHILINPKPLQARLFLFPSPSLSVY